MTESSSPRGGALLGAGLALVLVGERVAFATPTAHWLFTGLGLVLVVASTALRLMAAGTEVPERRRIELGLAAAGAAVLVGLALALATTEAGERAVGLARLEAPARQRAEAILAVAAAIVLAAATLPVLFAELALAPMRKAAHVEERRVRAAAASGLTLALALSYVALFTFAAGQLDVKADYSYFRTARPSESTKAILRSVSEPMKITSFFPQKSDVGREVEGYLHELVGVSPQVGVEAQDRLLVPALAKDLKVSSDGVVVFSRGKLRESVTIGTELAAARAKLKTLDAELQKALVKVTREQKVAYLTIGHGELTEAAAAPEGRTATGVRRLLEQQGYAVKELGLTQGLGKEVPNDATLVIVLGPSQPLAPGEVDALRRYADRGGRLFLALDPDARVDLAPVAATVGLSFAKETLVNDRTYLQRNFNASDRAILVTNRFSSHASISTLARNSARSPVVFQGASALDKLAGGDPALKIDFAVRSMADSFADADGDYRLSGEEKRGTWNLVAAVQKPIPGAEGEKEKPELRAFVAGDADAFSDAYLGNEANVVLFVDAVRWLGGEESWAGAPSTTEDVKIEHTKQKDVAWFYATILGIPSLVLGLGLVVSRRNAARRPS